MKNCKCNTCACGKQPIKEKTKFNRLLARLKAALLQTISKL